MPKLSEGNDFRSSFVEAEVMYPEEDLKNVSESSPLIQVKKHSDDLSWIVAGLVLLAFQGVWMPLNALGVELPVFVNHVPEGLLFPSYVTIAQSIGNVVGLLYVPLRGCFPRVVHERTAAISLMIIEQLCLILLCIFWKNTMFIFGEKRSVIFIILVFIAAIADGVSSLALTPFMALLPRVYISPFYLGGVSARLMPSLIALFQGVDHASVHNLNSSLSSNNTGAYTELHGLNFSPEWYMTIVLVFAFTGLAAFVALNYSETGKRYHVSSYTELFVKPRESEREHCIPTSFLWCNKKNEIRLQPICDSMADSGESVSTPCIWLLILVGWTCLVDNGFIPQLFPFASLPYGSSVYHYGTILFFIAMALTVFLYSALPARSTKAISLVALIFTLSNIYLIVVASQSPHPIMQHRWYGTAVLITMDVISGVTFAYVNIAGYTVMSEKGTRHLFWCGTAILLGSILGGAAVFYIVSVAKLFKG